MEIKNLKDMKTAYRNRFVFPGGYPTHIITKDGGNVCHRCFRECYRDFVSAMKNGYEEQWLPIYLEVNWEHWIICDHCYEPIESAYEPIDGPENRYCPSDCEYLCDRGNGGDILWFCNKYNMELLCDCHRPALPDACFRWNENE